MSESGNNPIYPLFSTWITSPLEQSQNRFMNKIDKGIFCTTLNEVIWPEKNTNFMHGLKNAIWQFFRNWLIGSHGLAMPC